MHSHITPHNFIDGTDGFERVKSSEDIFIPIRSKFSRHDTMNGYVRYESSVILPTHLGLKATTTGGGVAFLRLHNHLNSEICRKDTPARSAKNQRHSFK